MAPQVIDAHAYLADLASRYEIAKAQALEATARLKDITDEIKNEMRNAAPDADSILLAGPVSLRLTYRESWRLDTKALKATEPETFVRYAVKTQSWALSKGND